jgi:predicted kinase
MLSKAIRAGRDVVVDSTALTNEWRQRILRVAEEASCTPLEKVAIFLDTPVEFALSRNQNREKPVPEDAIREMNGHVRPPSKEEGFSNIVTVRSDKILSRQKVNSQRAIT